ncbi:MAG: 3-keto-disaccharide hydrolase [Planctomycetota bacterium]
MFRQTLVPTFAVVAVAAAGALAGHAQTTRIAAGTLPADPGASMSLGARPPAIDEKTVVLFDGSSWAGWVQRDGSPSRWIVQDDGSVLPHGGDAISRHELIDFQLHVEFLCPVMSGSKGQARGNSGVYLHGRYEVQVLDSFGRPAAKNGCGAIYSIAAPSVNASRPPGTWQTYDIIFRAPRYGPVDELLQRPHVTVLHNGVVIHNNLEIPKTTPGGVDGGFMRTMGPILLQDHGDPVRYRNLWVRPLD